MKIRVGDKVKVVKGKDRTKEGLVKEAISKTSKVLVEGVNQYKKNQKRKSDKEPGGIITITKPLPVGNVKLICPKCNQPTRVGFRIEKDNKKYRICKKCKEIIN